MGGAECAGAGIVPDRNDGVLIILVLEREIFFVLIGLAVGGSEGGGKKIVAIEQLLVIERDVDASARKDHQAAAAAKVEFEEFESGFGTIGHIGQNDGIIIIELDLRQLDGGD